MNHNVDLFDVPINAPVSCRINGKDLREFGIELTAYPSSLFLPPVRERLHSIDARSGSRDYGASYDNWGFTLTGQFRGLTHADFISKKTEFLRWMDMQQHFANEWLVSQQTVNTLRFELAGHRYFYRTGTIAVTNGSPTITGTSTKWLSFLKPNSEFRISDNRNNRYTIASVDSDTQLTLSSNVTESTDSGLSYEAERKRYLLVNYSGESSISSISRASFKERVFDFNVGFRTVYPYWIGDEFEQEESSVSAGDFISIYGLGTAPFGPRYQIVGAATNPKICACEMAFTATFNGNVKARTILNDADVLPSATSGYTYKATKNTMGLYITGSDTCNYTSVPGNTDKFSFLIRVKLGFAYDTGADKYLFEFYGDTNNNFKLMYNYIHDDFVLIVESGGVESTLIRTTYTQTFAADTNIEIAGWYDVNGKSIDGTTYYGKIFINGVEAGSTTSSVTAPATAPASLWVGSKADTTGQCDSTIDELVLWVIAITDEEVTKHFIDGEVIHNSNSTISYTGTLAANDILTIQSSSGHSELFDYSTGLATSADGELSGREPSVRGDEPDELGLLYIPNAISGKLRVMYAPHFR
jgi:hypothetical protein